VAYERLKPSYLMKFGIVVREKLPSKCEFRENWHSDCDSVLCGVMECLPTLWVFIGGLFGIMSRKSSRNTVGQF